MLERISEIPGTCANPEHHPPAHIVLPPGVYRHTCPGCGKTSVFTVSGRVSRPALDTLTDAEIATLRLVAAGKRDREIADSLNYAVGTIKMRKRRIQHKLGTNNGAHSVGVAYRLGIL